MQNCISSELKELIRLCICSGCCAPLLYDNAKRRFLMTAHKCYSVMKITGLFAMLVVVSLLSSSHYLLESHHEKIFLLEFAT